MSATPCVGFVLATIPPMAIYVAASCRAADYAETLAGALRTAGYTVTSDWHAAPLPAESSLSSADKAARARHDLARIDEADTLVQLTSVPSTTGGMHIELGYALGRDLRIAVLGPLPSVFHALDDIEQVRSIDGLIAALASMELRRLRTRASLTHAEVATAMEVDPQHLADAERNLALAYAPKLLARVRSLVARELRGLDSALDDAAAEARL